MGNAGECEERELELPAMLLAPGLASFACFSLRISRASVRVSPASRFALDAVALLLALL